MARVVARALGQEVTHQSPSVDAFEAGLKSAAVSGQYIGMFTTWGMALAQASLAVAAPTLAMLLGRTPTTVQQCLPQAYGPN